MENREIKFRTWCSIDKYFEYGDLHDFPQGLYDGTLPQQFTGLKDKNGREIYEGDRVNYDGESDITYHKPGIVSIGEYFTHAKKFEHFGIRVKRIDMDSYFGLNFSESKDYLIIGNIFENPELLKKKLDLSDTLK